MAGTIILSKVFSGGQTFTVAVNDILYEPVQCIVNAANGMLAHGGGVAAVIAEAAGSVLLADCREIISKRGRIPSGHAVVSKAGDLPFRGVIHAVGPKMGEGEEEKKIVQALREAFDLAEERRWKSLSFPAISSGIFLVPLTLCAKSYLRAVKEFYEQKPGTQLREIRLCLFMGPLLDEVKKEWQKVFAD
ncbi:MAG: macro domain-containing protein [Chrysiogenales bacterium]|nr:MAG: macro domain-containing protein [Chrysiogenales bacterium]